jgi:hypothetical protein
LSDTSGYLLTDKIAMSGLTSYDRAETDDRDVFATLYELFGSLRNFTGTGHPDYGYLFISSTITLETIYRTGKQLRGYEFVEPADYDSVIALAGCYLTFYFFNHSLASPNYIHDSRFVTRDSIPDSRVVTTHTAVTHYKTLGGCFPEKQPSSKRTPAHAALVLGTNLCNCKSLQSELPAKFYRR